MHAMHDGYALQRLWLIAVLHPVSDQWQAVVVSARNKIAAISVSAEPLNLTVSSGGNDSVVPLY